MNHEKLPAGYRLVETMDFVRNKKQLLTVNIAAIISAVIMAIAGLLIWSFAPTGQFLKENWWGALVLAGMYLAYIPLHELVHGIPMYLLSGVKPKYGLKLCYAYAGSDVWFDRRSHSIIALAPLLFWGVVLAVLPLALPEEWFWLLYIIQISNVSGSMGDVYCVLHLRRLPKELLIQDTGTRMRVFAPRTPAHEETK